MPPDPAAFSSSAASHAQPRFVRHAPDPAHPAAKPRFSLRNRLSWHAHLVDPLLSLLRIRRTKRARSCLAFAVLALAVALLFCAALRVAHPRSLARLAAHDARPFAFNASFAFAPPPAPRREPVAHPDDDDAAAVLDADKPNLHHADGHADGHADDGAGDHVDDRADDHPGDHAGDHADDHADGHADDHPARPARAARAASPVRADVPAITAVREKYTAANMSIVVLFHNEYDSMKYALASWIDNGLIHYVQEILFFLNGVPSETAFRNGVPDYDARIPAHKRRLYVSKENLPLGLAITKMIELASHEYILLLEKDWELIEPPPVMQSRLNDSKVIVASGIAHLVRHRHRHNPGVPLHALIMHQGREDSIIRQQKNLLCFVHHWQPDPPNQYPGSGIMTRCGGNENNVAEVDVYCSSSVYCGWNNNPGVFKRQWFIDEVGERYKKEYAIEFQKYGKTSPFLDFEYYTNWRTYAWTDKNITVAVGTGLFRHAESEHKYFNTFWYAHYRLTEDMKELREHYLKNETAFKKRGGVHYDLDSPKIPPMMIRYPVDFVRKFQFKEMFTGTLETQQKMIHDHYKRFQDSYRILTEEEWKRTGPDSEKAKKNVDWRREITNMHHVVEKAMMTAPFKLPYEMSITLVTCLLDIGRNELADDAYQFRRDFKIYLDAMSNWLTHQYPKTVYTSKRIADELLKTMGEKEKESTKFVYITRDDLRTKWLGPDNYAKVQEIRTSKSWTGRASWLENSPQAGLKDYNPLVMSKMFMVRDAARQNYWNTSHFVFIDAKHNCQQPKVMTPKNDHILRAHMLNKFLLTTFDYTPASEVHGFEYTAFNSFCNKRPESKRHLLKIGRGGIFGGSAFVLEYITAMYDMALTATLRQGLMGTEENVLSILKYQVPQYVDDFSNNWACPQKIEGDHTCPGKKDQGYNCAIFDWVARDAVREE